MPFIGFQPQPPSRKKRSVPNPFVSLAQQTEQTPPLTGLIGTPPLFSEDYRLSQPSTEPIAEPIVSQNPPAGEATDDPFRMRMAELDKHRESIQRQIEAIEQYLGDIHTRFESYRQLSEEMLRRSREEMENVISRLPQREPITKAEAIAVGIAALFNPAAAGAAAAGIMGAKEQRYQEDLKRYEMLAENAIRRYQIESQQASSQLRNLVDYAQTDLQRNMMLLQSLYNQLGATEQQKNQLLRLQQQNEWMQSRLALQAEWNDIRARLGENRLMLDYWKAEEQLSQRRGELLNRTLRLLSSGVAAEMTPEQIQEFLRSVPGLEEASVLNHPSMQPLLQNVAKLAESSQLYRAARAQAAAGAAELLAKYGEQEMLAKLELMASRIKNEALKSKLLAVRAELAKINLNDAKQGKVSPSALNQLAITLITMDEIARWAEENNEPLSDEFYNIRDALGEVMMMNLRPLGINANLNPPRGLRGTPGAAQPSPPQQRQPASTPPTPSSGLFGGVGVQRGPQQSQQRQRGGTQQRTPPGQQGRQSQTGAGSQRGRFIGP